MTLTQSCCVFPVGFFYKSKQYFIIYIYIYINNNKQNKKRKKEMKEEKFKLEDNWN